MRTLRQLMQDVDAIKKNGGHTDDESPIFEGFCDFLETFTAELEEFKVNGGVARSIPQSLYNLLLTAFSWGAADALHAAKDGYLLTDEEGNVIDKAYFSLDELLNAAIAMTSPKSQKQDLAEELEVLKAMQKMEQQDRNGKEDSDEEVTENPNIPKHLH